MPAHKNRFSTKDQHLADGSFLILNPGWKKLNVAKWFLKLNFYMQWEGKKARYTFKDLENLTHIHISWGSYLSMYWSQLRVETKKGCLEPNKDEKKRKRIMWNEKNGVIKLGSNGDKS